MLSIRSGGIWPRRTPARGGLRGTTALAYGGSRRAMAHSAQPPPRMPWLPARNRSRMRQPSACNRPGAPGLSGEKRTRRSFSGKIWTLKAPRAYKSRPTTPSVSESRPKTSGASRMSNWETSNWRQIGVKLGQSHFDQFDLCPLPLRSGLVHASERVKAARIAYIRQNLRNHAIQEVLVVS